MFLNDVSSCGLTHMLVRESISNSLKEGVFAECVQVFWLERMFSEYLDTLGPHANAALCSPQPPLPWTLKDNAGPNDVSPYKDRLGYIVTTQNLVVSEMAQRGMMTASGQTWRVAKRECGDAAPFLHKAHETVKLLGEMIEAFQEVVTAELAESAPRGGKGNV